MLISKNAMKLFAMVTTKSSARYTDLALDTFFKTVTLAEHDVFILINNDADRPYQMPENYPQLQTITNPSPIGFAANVNQILRIAQTGKADVFFLNNDLVFTKNWISPLLVDEPWILSPISNREVAYNTESFVWTDDISIEYYHQHANGFQDWLSDYNSKATMAFNILVLPFFCVKLPYTVYSVVGAFDEQYGKGGGEDFDYCLRAIQHGFAVKHAPRSFVLHFGGRSSWSGAETRQQQLNREQIFFEHFESVWGKKLTDLILRDDHTVLANDSAAVMAANAGNFQEVIKRLKV